MRGGPWLWGWRVDLGVFALPTLAALALVGATRAAGISVPRIKLFAYGLCGLLTGLAGVVLAVVGAIALAALLFHQLSK